MNDIEKRRVKALIQRNLRRYLRDAREKEGLLLTGLASEFAREKQLMPEEIELVRQDRGDETVFFFRKRSVLSDLLLPPKPGIIS